MDAQCPAHPQACRLADSERSVPMVCKQDLPNLLERLERARGQMGQSSFRISDSWSLLLCAPHLCSKKDQSSRRLASTYCIPRLCHTWQTPVH